MRLRNVLLAAAAGASIALLTPKFMVSDNPIRGQRPVQQQAEKAETGEENQFVLRVFPGYEDPVYSVHDSMFARYADFWNRAYRHENGFRQKDPNLFKAQSLVESGGRKHLYAWLKDPMQISNEGDYALGVLSGRLKRECSVPEGGYPELWDVQPAPMEDGKWQYDEDMTPEKSIEFGIRWDVQKGSIFDKYCRITGMRSDREMLSRYNGGGDPRYLEKIERIYGPLDR